jgi:hypothetical protein
LFSLAKRESKDIESRDTDERDSPRSNAEGAGCAIDSNSWRAFKPEGRLISLLLSSVSPDGALALRSCGKGWAGGGDAGSWGSKTIDERWLPDNEGGSKFDDE